MGRRLSVYRTFCGKISKRSKGGSLVPTWAIGQKIPSFCRWGSPFDQRRAFVCDERSQQSVDHNLHADRRPRHNRLSAYGHPANESVPAAGGGSHKITSGFLLVRLTAMTPAFTPYVTATAQTNAQASLTSMSR